MNNEKNENRNETESNFLKNNLEKPFKNVVRKLE